MRPFFVAGRDSFLVEFAVKVTDLANNFRYKEPSSNSIREATKLLYSVLKQPFFPMHRIKLGCLFVRSALSPRAVEARGEGRCIARPISSSFSVRYLEKEASRRRSWAQTTILL